MTTSTRLPLQGLRVVEFSSFVAGPTGAMTMGQLGAEVVRVDPLGGAPDIGRWPLSARSGDSLFWNGLNRGKRSVVIDVRRPEGQELLVALAMAPGDSGGILMENQGRPWLAPEVVSGVRPDAIHVRIEGAADGRPAVDYTVNPDVGLPWLTGPESSATPVNHVLPAWDLVTGMTAAVGILAALRHRQSTGEGTYTAISLEDVALAHLAGMGWLTEAEERGEDRERVGNYLYGSYGVDFATGDGERVMVVALTGRHWNALVRATGTAEVFKALEPALGVDLSVEGDRYRCRETITSILRPWFASRPLAEVQRCLDESRVLWSRYRRPSDIVDDFRAGRGSQILAEVQQPGTGPVISARSPLRCGADYGDVSAAPALGEDTDRVLADVLSLSGREIDRLHHDGVIAGRRD